MITAGSRGIANIDRITKATVDTVRSLGGTPTVLSAMGSHGGYTEAGQRALLAGYGITGETMGCPVECPVAVTELGTNSFGLPIFFCTRALAADGIIAVNRIKPHTNFTGKNESGLLKILAIGLGRRPGANQIHRLGTPGMRDLCPEVGRYVIAHTKVILGVGVVENAYHQTALIEAIAPDRIAERESELLAQAYEWMARFHFDNIDLLIVDEIGKEMSGTGMDPNVIGRKHGEPDHQPHTQVNRIAVLDLTEQTHGNACGIGMADLVSRRLFDAIDFSVFHMNILTSVVLEGAKIPLVCATDDVTIRMGVYGSWQIHTDRARVVRFKNTLSLGEIQVSTAIADALNGTEAATVADAPFDLAFDESGTLTTAI